MKVTIYTQKGTKTKESIELQENVFGAKVNEDLMAQSVRVFLANQRQGTKKTKHRGEVRGGGKKPWAQKTPDKARHGSRRSPIWVGGGHVHALRPTEWRLRLPLRMKRQAIFSAFKVKLNDGALKVVKNIKVSEEKLTKQVAELFENFGKGKILVVVGEKNDNLYLGSKNLRGLEVTLATELNTYALLRHDTILLQEDAIAKIHELWGMEKPKIESQKSKIEDVKAKSGKTVKRAAVKPVVKKEKKVKAKKEKKKPVVKKEVKTEEKKEEKKVAKKMIKKKIEDKPNRK